MTAYYCKRCGLSVSLAVAHPTLGACCPVCMRRLAASPPATPAPKLLKLYKRDGGICWLCRAPVDERLMGQSKAGAPTRDHVVPRSRGGSNEFGNLRLAHSWCNLMRARRGDMTADGRLIRLTAAQVAAARRMFGQDAASDAQVLDAGGR